VAEEREAISSQAKHWFKATNLATADSIFVAFGDFNGDRKLDLAGGKHEHRQRECALGQCDGTFQPAMNHEAGSGPNGRGVGDFNRDGKLDLVLSCYN